jgi:hypothetical protein
MKRTLIATAAAIFAVLFHAAAIAQKVDPAWASRR